MGCRSRTGRYGWNKKEEADGSEVRSLRLKSTEARRLRRIGTLAVGSRFTADRRAAH
jgi:hypothetical protein